MLQGPDLNSKVVDQPLSGPASSAERRFEKGGADCKAVSAVVRLLPPSQVRVLASCGRS